jgi:hypothetical protein
MLQPQEKNHLVIAVTSPLSNIVTLPQKRASVTQQVWAASVSSTEGRVSHQ